MPKKGGKKKKDKGPAFQTDALTCEPFGFMANDIVITPLGMEVTIIGVKKPEGDPIGTMWAQYQMQGYRRAHEGIHIWRDKEVFMQKRQELLDSVNPVKLAEAKTAKAAKKDGKKDGKKKKK